MLRDKLIVNNVIQMAHDIRSPLFALQTVLEAPGEFNDKKRNLLLNAAKRLQEIADGILLENKSSEEINLSELIEEILNEKKVSNHQINFITCLENVSAKINSIEMKRVISNLINNAIEAFDGKQGEIKVFLEETNGITKIIIRDNGKGIPLSLIPKIFGKSYGKQNGNGLGLSHAKKYIKSLGGEIHLTSSPSQGTEICIEL